MPKTKRINQEVNAANVDFPTFSNDMETAVQMEHRDRFDVYLISFGQRPVNDGTWAIIWSALLSAFGWKGLAALGKVTQLGDDGRLTPEVLGALFQHIAKPSPNGSNVYVHILPMVENALEQLRYMVSLREQDYLLGDQFRSAKEYLLHMAPGRNLLYVGTWSLDYNKDRFKLDTIPNACTILFGRWPSYVHMAQIANAYNDDLDAFVQELKSKGSKLFVRDNPRYSITLGENGHKEILKISKPVGARNWLGARPGTSILAWNDYAESERTALMSILAQKLYTKMCTYHVDKKGKLVCNIDPSSVLVRSQLLSRFGVQRRPIPNPLANGYAETLWGSAFKYIINTDLCGDYLFQPLDTHYPEDDLVGLVQDGILLTDNLLPTFFAPVYHVETFFGIMEMYRYKRELLSRARCDTTLLDSLDIKPAVKFGEQDIQATHVHFTGEDVTQRFNDGRRNHPHPHATHIDIIKENGTLKAVTQTYEITAFLRDSLSTFPWQRDVFCDLALFDFTVTAGCREAARRGLTKKRPYLDCILDYVRRLFRRMPISFERLMVLANPYANNSWQSRKIQTLVTAWEAGGKTPGSLRQAFLQHMAQDPRCIDPSCKFTADDPALFSMSEGTPKGARSKWAIPPGSGDIQTLPITPFHMLFSYEVGDIRVHLSSTSPTNPYFTHKESAGQWSPPKPLNRNPMRAFMATIEWLRLNRASIVDSGDNMYLKTLTYASDSGFSTSAPKFTSLSARSFSATGSDPPSSPLRAIQTGATLVRPADALSSDRVSKRRKR